MEKCKDCGVDVEIPRDGRCDECIRIAYTIPLPTEKHHYAYFEECPECAAKPGSPALCGSCLHNRTTIEKLKSVIDEVEEKLLSIQMATTHQWLDENAQHSTSEDRFLMFMACVKDCRRLSDNTLEILRQVKR